MIKIRRRIRESGIGPIDHWDSKDNPGTALCGFAPLGLSSGIFDVLPYGQLVNPYNNRETLAVEAVSCVECRNKLAELVATIPASELVRTTPVETPSRALFEAASADEGCVMCSG